MGRLAGPGPVCEKVCEKVDLGEEEEDAAQVAAHGELWRWWGSSGERRTQVSPARDSKQQAGRAPSPGRIIFGIIYITVLLLLPIRAQHALGKTQ